VGCGNNKIDGAVNLDTHGFPDVYANALRLPFGDGIVEKIYFFHTIEHIRKTLHFDLFQEFKRVLKEDGQLLVSYPEFTTVAQYFLENKWGMRSFWEATIYGRQVHAGDHHVSLMYTPYFINFLKELGFVDVKSFPEPAESFNTVVKCKKGPKLPNIVDRYKRDFFAN
jgi:predicted SAM-dependent methyltransferase